MNNYEQSAPPPSYGPFFVLLFENFAHKNISRHYLQHSRLAENKWSMLIDRWSFLVAEATGGISAAYNGVSQKGNFEPVPQLLQPAAYMPQTINPSLR